MLVQAFYFNYLIASSGIALSMSYVCDCSTAFVEKKSRILKKNKADLFEMDFWLPNRHFFVLLRLHSSYYFTPGLLSDLHIRCFFLHKFSLYVKWKTHKNTL